MITNHEVRAMPTMNRRIRRRGGHRRKEENTMRVLISAILLSILSVTVTGQALVSTVKVAVTSADSQEHNSRMASAFRSELQKQRSVGIVSQGADWSVYLDAVPLDDIKDCGGYAVAALIVDRRNKGGGQLRVLAGVSLEALARELATKLKQEFFKRY